MDTIAFFEIEEWEKEFLQKSLSDQVFFTAEKVQEVTDEKALQAAIISTFIYSELNKETLSKFPNLKLIATRSTGFDHIDLAYCKEKNITVVNVPSYGEHSVAEHTFALILAISRKIIPTVERTRKGDFSYEGLAGFDLAGKTLGIIGAGKIGGKMVKLALAFEMKVLLFTKHQDSAQLPENVSYASFDDLLSKSDIITLHVPLTEETKYMINRETIKKCKKGCVLINTARGPLIETQAILDGLETGILSAAGLDVLEEECTLKEERELLTDEYLKKCDIKTQLLNHVLLTREDVLFTSHNAFHSRESVQAILVVTSENIKSFLENKPQNVVS